MKKNFKETILNGPTGKWILSFCLSALLPLTASAQQITAKNEVIDCGNVIYEHPVTVKFELQNRSTQPGHQGRKDLVRMYPGGISQGRGSRGRFLHR